MRTFERLLERFADLAESQTGFEWFAAGSGLVMLSLVLLHLAQ